MTRTITYILSTTVATGLAIICLFMIVNRVPSNGFKRKVKDVQLKYIKTIDLNSKSIVFASTAEAPLTLKDFKDPKEILSIHPENGRIIKSVLKIPNDFTLTSGYINIGTVSPRTFVTNGKTGDVVIIDREENRFRHKVPNLRFDQSIAISNSSMIVRSKTTIPRRYRELIKLTFRNRQITTKSLRLPRQIDGIFCTDGWLQYDPFNVGIIYIYYYRGQFLYLDTNLNIKYTAKTIDTVKTAKIQVAIIPSRLNDSTHFEEATQIKPPPIINRYHTSFADRIYILSTLKADNESSSAFKENQVIDVYSSLNGRYIYSFYIPKYLGNKLRQFRISKNGIYCIFKNYLVEYSFNALEISAFKSSEEIDRSICSYT